MSELTRDQILQADDIKKVMVSVPEWGGDVYVKGMNGAERDKFESSLIQQKANGQSVNLVNIRAKLCSLTICDSNGNALFTEKDIDALSKKSANALTKVFLVAQKLSGIGDEEVKELADELQTHPLEGSVSG